MIIDVIIPSFNRASLLERALQSVLNQTFPAFHVYVVDDGSTDDTEIIMQKYSHNPKFHYLKQENKGVSSARNLGIEKSQNDWISFLDSDDEWLPNKLQVQAEFLLKNPSLRFIHSNEIWIRNNVRVNPKNKFDKSNNEIFKRSLETCLISPSTVLMKRELAKEHGNFNEEFLICEDYDLWLKILAREDVGFIPDYLVKKYGGHDQLSTKFPAMDYWRIKSLIRLLKVSHLEETKKNLVLAEINKKAPILLNGFQKHQNFELFNEITELLKF